METQHARYITLTFTCTQGKLLFTDESSRLHFLQLAEKWLFPAAPLIAWSLGDDRATFMLERPEDNTQLKLATHQLCRKFSRYLRKKTKNKTRLLTSKLTYLQEYTPSDLRDLVVSIHLTPLMQGLGENFIEYPWTSYLHLLNPKHCNLDHIEALSWFGGKQKYRNFHHHQLEKITGE